MGLIPEYSPETVDFAGSTAHLTDIDGSDKPL
jgi:hypothetical protein